MIKNPTEEQQQNVTMSVLLKNGRQYKKMDITSQPSGQYERVLSFWDGDIVKVFPMGEVAEYHLHFD